MATNRMQAIAAKLREQKEKSSGTSPRKGGGDNASYPFWDMKFDESATVRFLPDKDETNDFFWVGRETIKLNFAGQTGGDYPTDGTVTVTVPCVNMFGDSCPITNHIRPWWKQGAEKEALARQFYKKKSYLYQGFAVVSPLAEDPLPENPIRRFVVNPSIQKIISESLMNAEFEDDPTDYLRGRDFTIKKSRQGEYANYGSSMWKFSSRALNDAEHVAIEQHGLFDLKTFLGPRPDADGIAMIEAMFKDSLAGNPFDFDAYGKTYRAYGVGRNSNNRAPNGDPDALPPATSGGSAQEEPASSPGRASTSAPATTEGAASPRTTAILERLRAKQAGN